MDRKAVSIQTRLLSGSWVVKFRISLFSGFYTDPPIKRVFLGDLNGFMLRRFYTDPPTKRVSNIKENSQNSKFLYRPAYKAGPLYMKTAVRL